MTRAHIRLFSLLATVTLALGGALAQDDDAAAVPTAEAWAELINTGDAQAAIDLHTEDAIWFHPAGEVVEGRETIVSYVEGAIAAQVQVIVDILEVEVGNDLAYQTHFVAVTDVDGNLLTQGYGLVILKRVDGEWRWHRHLQNVILPEPAEDDMDGSE